MAVEVHGHRIPVRLDREAAGHGGEVAARGRAGRVGQERPCAAQPGEARRFLLRFEGIEVDDNGCRGGLY